MPTILVPGINQNTDQAIRDILIDIATGSDIETWIEGVYKKKVEGYSAQAPFAVPGDLTLEIGTKTFFSYRDRLFSGTIIDNRDPGAVKFKKDTIKQHMVNGTTRKFVDNGNGKKDQPITDSKSWPNADNQPFWDDKGKTPYYERVRNFDILVEEQYYAVLKPYFQYVRLVADYNKYSTQNEETLKADTLKKIGALFFESARKVQPNGKLPKYRPQDSHPIPGIPNITRINKDEIKVYWAGCEHHSYWVTWAYGDTPAVNAWKRKDITGTSILVDAKGQKLHVALAFARYNPMTNNVSVPAPVNKDPRNNNEQTPDQNSTGWSYKVFPLGPSTALPEHVVTMQLFDIDRFRLQLDKQYPDITIFDIFQMLQKERRIGSSSTLEQALQAALTAKDENFNSDYFSVKWEHIDVPVGRTNNRSWQQFTYVEKVIIIHRSRIFDLSDQMSIHNIPSVVLDPDEYSRPAKSSVLGKRDFDVVDRAIQSARTKEYHRIRPNATDNILKKPWQQAKHHFKVHERGRGTFFANFIYLNNRRETEACKRLRRTRRSLDLSIKIGVPVIPKKIIAPFPYLSHASSKRSTTFGVNNYDRMQSYPAVQELPRTFVPAADPNLTEKVASTASLLPIDKKMRSATFYNIRVNSGAPKELPHPGYPSRAKATAWQSIVNTVKLPSIPFIAINGGAAVIDDKPIVLEL